MNIWSKLKIKWWKLQRYDITYRLQATEALLTHGEYIDKITKLGITQDDFKNTLNDGPSKLKPVFRWVPVKISKEVYTRRANKLLEANEKSTKYHIKTREERAAEYRAKLAQDVREVVKPSNLH